MENALRCLFGNCFNLTSQENDSVLVSTATGGGVSALAHDLFHFQITSEVPEQLSGQVASSIEAQTTWYVKLLQAWRAANPPPKTSEQASRLVIQTLDMADVEGLLNFYGLPVLPHDRLEVPEVGFPSPPRAEQTLPVDARSVGSGNSLNVFVDAADSREVPNVPEDVQDANPPPKTPQQESRLVFQTLEMADVEGLLNLYGLPILCDRIEAPTVVFHSPRAERVKFVLQTLPVDARNVSDGDCLNVFADPREAPNVPEPLQEALSELLRASASKDYATADTYYQTIVEAGYRILRTTNNEAILAENYRVRLRGIDAPNSKMQYGKEAKDELTQLVQGKCLTIHVYGVDKLDRLVGDVYCNGLFAQEVMLKKGCAWHHAADFYQRPELAKWEMEARAAGLGLWASSIPEEPQGWRKNNPAEMPWEWRIPIINNKMLGS